MLLALFKVMPWMLILLLRCDNGARWRPKHYARECWRYHAGDGGIAAVSTSNDTGLNYRLVSMKPVKSNLFTLMRHALSWRRMRKIIVGINRDGIVLMKLCSSIVIMRRGDDWNINRFYTSIWKNSVTPSFRHIYCMTTSLLFDRLTE